MSQSAMMLVGNLWVFTQTCWKTHEINCLKPNTTTLMVQMGAEVICNVKCSHTKEHVRPRKKRMSNKMYMSYDVTCHITLLELNS